MSDAYIVQAIRTAGGRRNGKLAAWHPADMAGEVLNALVDRSGIDANRGHCAPAAALNPHRKRRALASALIAFARETEVEIIAEGVETSAELSTLQSLGVKRAQGYYLARPKPLADLHGAMTLAQPMTASSPQLKQML